MKKSSCKLSYNEDHFTSIEKHSNQLSRAKKKFKAQQRYQRNKDQIKRKYASNKEKIAKDYDDNRVKISMDYYNKKSQKPKSYDKEMRK